MLLSTRKNIELLARRLVPASRLTVLTGAGVSAASGVPTFRGPGGPLEGLPARKSWRPARRSLGIRGWSGSGTTGGASSSPAADPTGRTRSSPRWSRRYPVFRLITQNVDGLHERAGTQGLTRFHGSLWDVSCWNRCGGAPPRWRDETVPFEELPPRCPHCGGWVRPGVVWFGEPIEAEVLRNSGNALDCDVCLVVGTSSVVYPAAGLAGEARRRGSFVAVVNPDADAGTEDADLVLAGRAEEVLDEIEEALTRESER